jgi:hypothetical protein
MGKHWQTNTATLLNFAVNIKQQCNENYNS